MFSLFILHMSTAEWIHGLSINTHIFNNPHPTPECGTILLVSIACVFSIITFNQLQFGWVVYYTSYGNPTKSSFNKVNL